MFSTGNVIPDKVAPNDPTIDTPVYVISFLFPVRHFMEVIESLLYLDGTFADYWTNIAILILFMLMPILLLPRLKNALTTHQYDTIE